MRGGTSADNITLTVIPCDQSPKSAEGKKMLCTIILLSYPVIFTD